MPAAPAGDGDTAEELADENGYPAPALGTVTVALSPGAVTAATGRPTGTETWTYDLVDPHRTVPADTLTVARKPALSLNPTRADSGADGIPDGFKLAHPCLPAGVYVDTDPCA